MRIKLIMPRPNHNKTRVHLTINKDILEASRQYIPNLSQFFEEKLIEFLKYLNRPITKDFYGSARIRTGDLLRVRQASSPLDHGPLKTPYQFELY